MSSRKRKNVKLRKALKEEPCVVCGAVPSDPCHLRTFKVTQSDNPKNLLPMCRRHHNEQHKGWGPFLEKYPIVSQMLIEKGWEIIRHPFDSTKVILTHPEVK